MTWNRIPAALARSWLRVIAGLMAICVAGLALGFGIRSWDGHTYDLIIENGRVFSGEVWLKGTPRVGIRDGRIVNIGRLWGAKTGHRISAKGMVVSPGFIDTHVHIESSMGTQQPVRAPNFVRMGATTLITGNCGISHKRLEEVFRGMDRLGGQLNVASLVGHKTLREMAMGSGSQGSPTSEQMAHMIQRLQQDMDAGAMGFSTGLEYSPGIFAPRSEIVALARATGKKGGLYATHMRNEGIDLRSSLVEAVETAQQARVHLHVSHLKYASPKHWGEMPEVLAWMNAQRPGLPGLTADAYAYDASSSSLDLLLPEAYRGFKGNRRALLKDSHELLTFSKGILDQLRAQGFQDFSFARIVWSRNASIRGLTLDQVPASSFPGAPDTQQLASLDCSPQMREQLRTVLGFFGEGGGQMIYHVISDRDTEAVFQDPHVFVGSDSSVRGEDSLTAHPRGCGNFPRVLGHLVREKKVLSLEEALTRMTLLPARTFGLKDRGRIARGYAADVVVFDPAGITDLATYASPLIPPEGILVVMVNGKIILEDGRMHNIFPGRALRRTH